VGDIAESGRGQELDATPVAAAIAVSKRYGDGPSAVWAVRDCDLALFAGKIVAVVGPSGSGKSTLLHLISGLETPTSGDVRVGGRLLAGLGEQERARFRAGQVGYVLQRDNLIPSLTVDENVAAPLMIAGWPRARALSRAKDVLERVGLGARTRAWPAQLSGGEAQRAAIARACAGTPLLIAADEPTGALDSTSGSQVLGLFLDLVHGSGAAGLVVTHDPAVASAADRVLRMADGRLVEP